MGRHGTRAINARTAGTRHPARRTAPSRSGSSPGAISPVASSRILVAAVAAGAVVPAAQTLDTHVADAESTAELARGDLALAAQPTAPHPALAAPAPGPTVAPISIPAGGEGSTSSDTSAGDEASAGDEPSAGDTADVEALTKAISVARENGPIEFGTPYAAGDSEDLDGQIAKALGLMGLPQKLAPGVKKIIMRESTGDPDAVNDWDSNAAAGTPSKGLMQLIQPTFRNAVLPSLADQGIFDPVANITAGVRTMIANHGIDAVMEGGLRNSDGDYIGYGGAELPDDGLGRATFG